MGNARAVEPGITGVAEANTHAVSYAAINRRASASQVINGRLLPKPVSFAGNHVFQSPRTFVAVAHKFVLNDSQMLRRLSTNQPRPSVVTA